MDYDVIVVGAGPAGSTAAHTAADGGLSVLMLEKRQAIGEPVRCAEGITGRTKKQFKIPEHVIANRVERSEIISPSGYTSVLSGEGYILERISSDKFLAMRAIESGAELCTKARVTGAHRTDEGVEVHVVTPQGKKKVSAGVLIGADGRESNVGKWFGLDTKLKPSEMYKAFQYEMVMPVDKNTIKMYVGRDFAPGGYVWVFPKGDNKANVGVCVSGELPITAKQALDSFLIKTKMVGSVVRSACGTIPIVPASHPVCGENFMLVGDAARFVNPIHGGGMEEAMVSGELAGNAAKEGDVFSYAKKIRPLKDKSKKVVKLNSVMRAMSDDDFDAIIGSLPGEAIGDAITGTSMKAMVSLFKRRPSLLRFVPKLL